ncbi:MAG: HepT-like ribonuclease domain-containing protein [Patiriisocius sp.]|uniref:HepT-like ribonuclease domain-containing protein n=1 Tax=Patiriisocius sp. TaxID=2822396 RepID=UPI003EF753B1
MSKREDIYLLEDIIEAIQKIKEYTHEINFQDFIENTMIIDATIRNFEIIGEASNRLSETLKTKDSSIEWIKLSGFRNRLIHEYFGVNLELVWEIIQSDIPELDSKIILIINNK